MCCNITNGKKNITMERLNDNIRVRVLLHRECIRTAPRRGWVTINQKGKRTSLGNFGLCVFKHREWETG